MLEKTTKEDAKSFVLQVFRRHILKIGNATFNQNRWNYNAKAVCIIFSSLRSVLCALKVTLCLLALVF